MNQDNLSNVLWYCWIMAMGALGALNLRGIVRDMRERKLLKETLDARENKIIMLEARILYLETKLQDSYDNTGTN